jgi:ubiquitin carboxyl-terminal hydrolase 5/13
MVSSCQHLADAFSQLQLPRASQQVHREECTLCFDGQDGSEGVNVCLTCFNGGCSNNKDREHATLHQQKTGHNIVVNVKRRLKPGKEGAPSAPKKLAIEAETEADRYDHFTEPRCLACSQTEGKIKVLPLTEKLEQVINAVMKALSSAQQSEVKAWEEEIVACDHTKQLVQPGEPYVLEADGLAKCGKCSLDSNLWLCLTCGNLGCGRAQFGGIGGNSHGLAHFEETGHPVSVKQGTITAEGTADIYCYACNDARLDPQLAKHLSHFGINVMDLSKTEKSMTELQLEQNLKFDFNMTGDDGKQLQPVFGPGLTGLQNLGNSCYMASVLQSLFSLPVFRTRYVDAYRPHTLQCTNTLPASCLECQTCKVADGLLSGRYSLPRSRGQENTEDGPIFQEGIRPSMFKALIGKGHEEFSTMRQQDADEFLKHLFACIQREAKRLHADPVASQCGAPIDDPTTAFAFGLQQRLQCMECKKVRYTTEAQDSGLSLPVPIRVVDTMSKGKEPVEGENAVDDIAAASLSADSKVEYEPVDIQECLDIFTAAETLDYNCPSCDKGVQATKQTLFTTFPDILAVQVRRFQLINWVPQKVDVPIVVPLDGSLSLDRYIGTGKKDDEEELPDDTKSSSKGSADQPTFDVAAMSQLTAMGFPEIRCQRALLATGNAGDAEAAMNWLFAHMEDADIDDPIDYGAHTQVKSSGGGHGAGSVDAAAVVSLQDMGFTSAQARKALRFNGNNAELAVAWLFDNPGDAGDDEEMAETSEHNGAQGTSDDKQSVATTGGDAHLPARYRLHAFISHKGPSVHSGHYVAHVSEPASLLSGRGEIDNTDDERQWVLFNDEKVVVAPLTSASSLDAEKDVGVRGLSQLAYEYIWVRQR